MTLRVALRPSAVADFAEIWRFSAQEWGIPQADEYLSMLRDAIDRLSVTPGSGAAFEHVRAGYRRLFVGSHAIFYRALPDRLDIVRILHQRREATRLLR
jgi:toxin ParE1/3/4